MNHARALAGESLGLLIVIKGCVRWRAQAVPFAVAGYIVAAYWFTASTSFANPAMTFARSASGPDQGWIEVPAGDSGLLVEIG